MDKRDIIIAVVVGLVALAAIVGVIYLALWGREVLHTDNKIVNAGLALWLAKHLLSTILSIIVVAGAMYGVILYLLHFGWE